MRRAIPKTALISVVSCILVGSCGDATGPDTITPGITPPAIKGTMRIVARVTGTDLDPDGFTVALIPKSFSTSAVVPTGGSAEVSLPPGTYAVALDGIAGNCTVAPQPFWGTYREITVQGGSTAEVSFAVSCTPVAVAPLAPGTQLAFVRDGQIWRVNSDGSDPVRLTAGPRDADPAWSPDGRRIAFSRLSDAYDTPFSAIYTMDADGSNVVQVTEPADHREPAWSRDGRRIAVASWCPNGARRVEGCLLIVDPIRGDARRVQLGYSPPWLAWPAWSPDGMRIAFVMGDDVASNVFALNLSDSTTTPLTQGLGPDSPGWFEGFETARYLQPAWSPDGRELAVARCVESFVSGDVCAIALMNGDGSGERVLTPARGFARPTWSPDGRTIAFASGGDITWISAGGGERGVIISDGESPAWRP